MQTASARQGMFSLMVSTFKTEGPRGLYVGLSASLLRQMTYSVTRFGAYDKLKEMTIQNNGDGKPLGRFRWHCALQQRVQQADWQVIPQTFCWSE